MQCKMLIKANESFFKWAYKLIQLATEKRFSKNVSLCFQFFQPPFYFENIKMINDLNVRMDGDYEI